MMKKLAKKFDLYVNKFGYEISYDELMKSVPLSQTEKSDVQGQQFVVIISIFSYVANEVGMYSEIYGNITENGLEAIFAWHILHSVLMAAIAVSYFKAPKK